MLAKRTGMKVDIASTMPTLFSLASVLGIRGNAVTAFETALSTCECDCAGPSTLGTSIFITVRGQAEYDVETIDDTHVAVDQSAAPPSQLARPMGAS
jgi:hypothetical protein